MRQRRGFTLIELLVDIAVIAILAAILFPVFTRARKQARKTMCLHNVEQIGTGVMMYVQDYDESYPNAQGHMELAAWASPTYQRFQILVQPYIKNVQVRMPGGHPNLYQGKTEHVLWLPVILIRTCVLLTVLFVVAGCGGECSGTRPSSQGAGNSTDLHAAAW